MHTTDLESLFKFVPKKCLPNELGGQAGTYQELLGVFGESVEVLKSIFGVLERQISDLKENVDFFLELEKQVVDESKRAEKTEYRENMFGIEGTFKKLNID